MIDFSKVVLATKWIGEDEEETRLLRELSEAAARFLNSFAWCALVREVYIGLSIGGVVGVFLVRLDAEHERVDEWLWVVVGDLPPAYLVTDEAANPASALRAYIREMKAWVEAVRNGAEVDALIPVATTGGAEPVAPTISSARRLESRLDFLEEHIRTEHGGDLAPQAQPPSG